MSLVKSFTCGVGDMYYIVHNSDNFTIIDCSLAYGSIGEDTIKEMKSEADRKGIVRFISTHPDQDHLRGLCDLDDELTFVNFYCVKNKATKDDPTADFERYCELRDSSKAFYLFGGCSRRWMNESSEERGAAGLNVRWPVTSNQFYKAALASAVDGGSPNNLSCVLTYSLQEGVTMAWMGDLETTFMENVQDDIELPSVDILFAPHHGRKSGRVPDKWLSDLDPQIVVLGDCPAEHLHYYRGYSLLTQNSCGDIMFDCVEGKVHIYVGSSTYTVDFLDDEGKGNSFGGYYLGTLNV
ncbi:MAG: hypothetical protein ACRDJ4_08545 [Actinomycetota bacterium]